MTERSHLDDSGKMGNFCVKSSKSKYLPRKSEIVRLILLVGNMSLKYFVIFFLLISSINESAQAGDHSFKCLQEMDGALIKVRGDQGYQHNKFYDLSPGTRIDARGATFYGQTVPPLPDGTRIAYPVDIRSDTALKPPVCFAGAAIHVTNHENNGWLENYKVNHAAVISWGPQIIFDGLRIHNAHDGIRSRRTRTFWTIRNTWISYNRDDCIENDHHAPGLVEDSLFDGCYVFLSSRQKNSVPNNSVVTIQNNLIYMKEMPGPVGFNDPEILGGKSIFKFNADSPSIKLYNNIFLIENYASSKWEIRSPEYSIDALGFKGRKLIDCKNNVIVWLGPGEFPGSIPNDPACVMVTTDRTVFDLARENWLNNHPRVARIDGVDEP